MCRAVCHTFKMSGTVKIQNFTDFRDERRVWMQMQGSQRVKGKPSMSSSLRDYGTTVVQAPLDGEKGEKYLLLFCLVR